MSGREMDGVMADVTGGDVAPPPSTALALVPLPRPAVPQTPEEQPARPTAGTAHRWFYGMGYTGLAMILCTAWIGPASEAMTLALLIPAVMAVGVAGLGVLIHVLYRPRIDKLRKGLGAVAAVVLTLAAAFPVSNAALEVHASRRIVQVEPLAALASGTGGLREMGVSSPGWVELNGFRGDIRSAATVAMADGPPLALAQVLARDGISRLELVRLMGAMEAAEISRLETRAAYVAFQASGGTNLLYVRPGQVLPRPGTTILKREHWRTKPLGDGWYLLLW